ncbi:hypothetical protein GC197_16580 [bacterium]|nr:hypothetical protein [bacterium]
MKRSACWMAVCCFVLAVGLAGCAPSMESRLTGSWTRAVGAMIDEGTPGQKEAVVELNLLASPVLLNFNPDGTFSIKGTETEEGTWKVLSSSGDKATIELKLDGGTETVEIQILRDTLMNFQRQGQKVPYMYEKLS